MYSTMRARSAPSMGGTGRLPASRNATMASKATSRAVASCSGVRPPWSMIMSVGSMRTSSRSRLMSPVM